MERTLAGGRGETPPRGLSGLWTRALRAGMTSGPPFLVSALLLTGCGMGPGPEDSPHPVPAATPPPVELPELLSRGQVSGDSVSLTLPEEIRAPDLILDSPWARSPEMEPLVQDWITSFQTREAPRFAESLARMGLYRDSIEGELRIRGLPASLAYLPIVESWYSPTAVSRVGAAGLWQFMAPTARGMGLTVNRLLDQRRDPFLATPSALDFLEQLQGQFDSWFLALAAYNGGPGRVERILRNRAPGADGHDGLFMEILRDLPRETRDFVPRFLAAGRIARDPEAFGFQDIEPLPALAFDWVEVPDATSLDVVAQAAGVDLGEVEELNPQLLRGITPAGVPTFLRLPRGRGPSFAEAYAAIPPQERVTFVEHAVAKGETLTHIARLYGVPVADLQAANPTIQPRRMQIGQRVVVPKAPSVRSRLAAAPVAVGGGEEPTAIYRVQSGDTLSGIAQRHRVSLGDLLRWNGLTLNAVIRPGDEVKILRQGR